MINKIITSKLFRRFTRVWAYPILRRIVNDDLKKLKAEAYTISVNFQDADVLYLRTDFWLQGKSSNGAMAHTIGVVDALSDKCKNITVHTISQIDYLDSKIRQIEHPANGFFVGLGELEEMEYSHDLTQVLYQQLKDNPPSFIYQRYGRNNYSGALLSKMLGVPYVLEYNGSEIWMSKHWGGRLRYEKMAEEIELSVFQAADLIIGNAQALKDELVYRGIMAKKIIVIPNGVNTEIYCPQIDGNIIREKYGFSKENVIVSFVGSFGPWHGAEVLANAIQQIVEKNNKIRFMFVGDGSTLSMVRKIVVDSGMQDNVVFSGMVPQNITPLYLAASDILVSPQIPNPDGTPFFGSPTKLFEYMAVGKAIVASDLDQIGMILCHEKTALLIKPGNCQMLADAVLKLSFDKKLREKLGENARAEVVEKYTWHQHVEQFLIKLECDR